MNKVAVLVLTGFGMVLSASFAYATTECPPGKELLCRDYNPDHCVCVRFVSSPGHSLPREVPFNVGGQATDVVVGRGEDTYGGMHACDYLGNNSNACDARAEDLADLNAKNACEGNAVRISNYSCSTRCQRLGDTFGKRTNEAEAQYQCVNR